MWLIRFVHETIHYGGQVKYLLTDPEMAKLLAQAPQLGRILRPVSRMMGLSVPEAAGLPSRPKREVTIKPAKVAAKRASRPDYPKASIPGWPRPPTPFRKRFRKRRTTPV